MRQQWARCPSVDGASLLGRSAVKGDKTMAQGRNCTGRGEGRKRERFAFQVILGQLYGRMESLGERHKQFETAMVVCRAARDEGKAVRMCKRC